MRTRTVIAWASLLLLPGPLAPASQVFVKGTASATYFVKRIPIGLTLGTYQVNGYLLERGLPDWEGRVRFKVTVSADRIQSRAVFEPKKETIPSVIKDYTLAEANVPVGAKPFKKMAEDLVEDCDYQSEAVEAILTWIGENIAYDEKSLDESPAVVLEKKRGYCVGLANLALTLLRSVDIPARSALGLILTPDGAEGLETRMDYQLHRLIEVYYPDVGWVLSDPQRTVNFVSPAYIHWKAIEPGTPPTRIDLAGMQIFRAKEEGALTEEDLKAGISPARVFVRKNIEVRYSGTIEGRLQQPDGRLVAAGQISMISSAGVVRQPLRPDGSFSFIGLKGGEYTLRYDEGTLHASLEKIKLKDREIRQVALTIGSAGEFRP